MFNRRRFKQIVSLQDRLASFAEQARAKAAELPPGAEREDLLKRASRADTASKLDRWANSRGLQRPT